MSGPEPRPAEQPEQQLRRRFGLLPATALNMTNMIGVGPFITIPLLMSALGGPQAMLGWIAALVVTRILVQFIGQVFGLMLLRRQAPDMPCPYRMWLYPLPALVALLGWIFVFATTQIRVILFGVGVLGLGCLAFLIWSLPTNRRPSQTR